MKNQKLIQANEQMLQRQIQNGFNPQWYVVYHLNDGFNSRYQQRRRIDTDEVSKDVAFHKHTLPAGLRQPSLGEDFRQGTVTVEH